MQSIPMQIALPAPGRARNALCVEDEPGVFPRAWKQARHSIPANSLHGQGRRLQVLQCLVADIFINCLYRVVACDELLLLAHFLPASAVFFSSPALRSSDGSRRRNAA